MLGNFEISGVSDRDLKLIVRARTYEQYCKMIDDAFTGRCTFCQVDRDYNKVIFETDLFMTWPSKPPEKNTAKHFIIVPKRHITHAREMTDAEVLGLWGKDGIVSMIDSYLELSSGIKSTGFMFRDGAADLAGTIAHWHMHRMVPDGKGRVESPIYKGPEDDAKDLAKARVFEKVRLGTPASSLSNEERELVKGRKVPGID